MMTRPAALLRLEILAARGRLGDGQPIFAQALYMKQDSLAQILPRLFRRLARGHAPRKVGNIRGVISLRLFDDYRVSH